MSISIIIPTHNRAEILEYLLIELNNQKGKFEIIIVDDASTDGTRKMIKNTAPHLKYKLIYIQLKHQVGLPTSRNIGVRHSNHEIVGFIDDDCFPIRNDLFKQAKKWLKSKKSKIVGVGGPVFLRSTKQNPSLSKKEISSRMIGKINNIIPEIIGNFYIKPKKPILVDTLPGGNMYFNKGIIYRCMGFNPQFDGNHYREETDFCLKAKEYGKIIFDPKMLVNHLRVNFGGCRCKAEKWYLNIISNTTLLIMKHWKSPIEIIIGISLYFFKWIYNLIYCKEDQRYYNVDRNTLFRSILKGFWQGFKKYFLRSKKLNSIIIEEKLKYTPNIISDLYKHDLVKAEIS
ncbi:MAG: glycosyltransferase family 2 protein [Candidatus Lokiarchaeota archaeon]|nr:glycosyltransferase family 2 protein [Candidatus Lokiarchaeota archaeon]